MATKNEWVYDELICFLQHPLFQLPLGEFMDKFCIIFDPTMKVEAAHREAHEAYKRLVTGLLEGFREDAKLTHEQIISALSEMNKKDDLRVMFQYIFEEVLASESFDIFSRLMVQRNIELQQQALILVIQCTGGLSEAFQPDAPVTSEQNKSEEDVVKNVLKESEAQAQKEADKQKQEDEEIRRAIELSKAEQSRLQEQKETEQVKMEKAIHNLAISDPPKTTKSKSPEPAPVKTAPVKAAPMKAPPPQVAPVKSTPSNSLPSINQGKSVSNADAAANWLASAQAEASTGQSSIVNSMGANFSGLSKEELVRRQEFLKQQRDKLLEMKKTEREKQLKSLEKTTPQRPRSARVARSAISSTAAPSMPSKQEDNKSMAMRQAIADRLKQEVIGKK
ncbi:unnamed protein product [Owenia fusiformis]|uniref:Cilia- and flagella-associated protein 36 n=1 Tax=Owenia fusiformis TaxID=6347 RepID=A0A8J1XVE4_OWEFU|nr:unnamed protein product [Owenia fusiformis]